MNNSDKNIKYGTKSEVGRRAEVFGIFKQNDAGVDANHDTAPVLSMSSLGKFGRFGNQLFQYAFLRICSEASDARVECPPWIGQSLFGHQDAPITQRLPPAIEIKPNQATLFDIVPELIPYLEHLADAPSIQVDATTMDTGIQNYDLYGFFQLHSRYFQPHQACFRRLFQPMEDLKAALEPGLERLRAQGKTIVGLHIRRGDYLIEPRAGFTLVVPTAWYCEWLESIWDELEDPVLFIASDDSENILADFEKFSPVTMKNLDVQLPDRLKDSDAEFYIDFFTLTQCDIVCTSNSIFSFIACMLNERAKKFSRPHWNFETKFIDFDPWNSEPLLWLGDTQPKFLKSFTDIASIVYTTQGLGAALKAIFIYKPKSQIKQLLTRLYLGYQAQKVAGLIKSLLYTLGWSRAWDK
ncbi:alpha-1,2-fucosyltransferase [filamentous cyanobacterium LEGE 11480]|uniref:Alpha-1,2-fucosyltransferase n=1 Tax=Romeriopsis navalis LEGE 11480 TaxID=2777977 RepID=A0A928VMY3_9CYAN|nr:alpha-1,2-fucosyltransferase [Romeriopsis navalis]MBE9028919.1 alpha-1,2-fucosyltransferase [Romeriopsis navalis LEGE 11480]